MQIKIFWKNNDSTILFEKVNVILKELWLEDFIKVWQTYDEKLKKELNIKKEPALIVEEESIDFVDTIFEWIIPEDDELKSIFISIIGWWENWSCDSGGCWSCGLC